MANIETPLANRKHVGIFGSTNAGKSQLFNQILNQDLAIVSEQKGTTTDPVIKGMELIPYGPIALIDTAGFGDVSALGKERIEKTMQILERCDYIIYAVDITDYDEDAIQTTVKQFGSIPYTLCFIKIDLLTDPTLPERLRHQYKNAQFVNANSSESVAGFKTYLANELAKLGEEDDNLLRGIAKAGDHVVMVVPIDSAAPKGRLILPQVTFLRNCLDAGVWCTVTKEDTLEQVIASLPGIDLIVTDSQIFQFVAKIVPNEIPLTSFSMLLARQKGNIREMIAACDVIPTLQAGDRILMLEACTHNQTYDDIGRVKIPALLQKKAGVSLRFDYFVAYDFPKDLSRYKLAVHCGGCMITKKAVLSRMEKCKKANLPITNYGVILAYLNGISERCSEVFANE